MVFGESIREPGVQAILEQDVLARENYTLDYSRGTATWSAAA
jgi:hypothetical protein